MRFEYNFYSSFLLVFFIHGLVYAGMVWRKGLRRENPSDLWLAFFLLLGQLYILPWMVGFAGWYDNQPYRDLLFYIPFQHLYLLGPVVYFYVQSLLNPGFVFTRKDLLHFLPAALYLLFSLIVFITDKLVLQRYYFLVDEVDPDFDTWYQVTGFLSMFFYFALSFRYYRVYRRLIVQVVSYADTMLFFWIKRFLMAFLLILLVRALFYILDLIWGYWYTDTWWYFLAFALIVYYIAITGYSNSMVSRIAFRFKFFQEKKVYLLSGPSKQLEDLEVIEIGEPEQETNSSAKEANSQWMEKVREAMEKGKAYTDPELTLTQLARQLGTNPSLLSKVVNQGYKSSFNDMVNAYRVAAMKEKLIQKEHHRQTLLAIAFECGFNSKATFNRAFQRHTGQSPRDFTKSID